MEDIIVIVKYKVKEHMCGLTILVSKSQLPESRDKRRVKNEGKLGIANILILLGGEMRH